MILNIDFKFYLYPKFSHTILATSLSVYQQFSTGGKSVLDSENTWKSLEALLVGTTEKGVVCICCKEAREMAKYPTMQKAASHNKYPAKKSVVPKLRNTALHVYPTGNKLNMTNFKLIISTPLSHFPLKIWILLWKSLVAIPYCD